MKLLVPSVLAGLHDPRIAPSVRHQVLYIIVNPVSAVLCGADFRVNFAVFGRFKQPWLHQF